MTTCPTRTCDYDRPHGPHWWRRTANVLGLVEWEFGPVWHCPGWR